MWATSARSGRCASAIGTRSRIRYRQPWARWIFSACSARVRRRWATGNLLAAVEVQHYDGPFVTPDDARKENAVLRYSEGDEHNGYSLTAMCYHQLWTNTTDIPLRAITEGLVPNRFGTLDPTDGGRAWRASLSSNHARDAGRRPAHRERLLHRQPAAPVQRFHALPGRSRSRRSGGSVRESPRARRAGDYRCRCPVGRDRQRDLRRRSGARRHRCGSGDCRAKVRCRCPRRTIRRPSPTTIRCTCSPGAAYVQATTHWTSNFAASLGVARRLSARHRRRLSGRTARDRAGYYQRRHGAPIAAAAQGQPHLHADDTLELYRERRSRLSQRRHSRRESGYERGLGTAAHAAARAAGGAGNRRCARRRAPNLALTFALYNLWQQSETIIDPDVGQDTAGPPSRRYGYEINVTYQINALAGVLRQLFGRPHPFHPAIRRRHRTRGRIHHRCPGCNRRAGAVCHEPRTLERWPATIDISGTIPLSSGPCVDCRRGARFPGTSCANAPDGAWVRSTARASGN